MQPAFDNVVPALFGAMAYKYYRKNMKIALVPLVVMSLLFVFVPALVSSTSFMIIPSGAIAIGIAYYFYKRGGKHDVDADEQETAGGQKTDNQEVSIDQTCEENPQNCRESSGRTEVSEK